MKFCAQFPEYVCDSVHIPTSCVLDTNKYITAYEQISLTRSGTGVIIIVIALHPFVGPWWRFSVSRSYTQSVGFLERGISQSQGRYLHTG
jgi:hypothetical protein